MKTLKQQLQKTTLMPEQENEVIEEVKKWLKQKRQEWSNSKAAYYFITELLEELKEAQK